LGQCVRCLFGGFFPCPPPRERMLVALSGACGLFLPRTLFNCFLGLQENPPPSLPFFPLFFSALIQISVQGIGRPSLPLLLFFTRLSWKRAVTPALARAPLCEGGFLSPFCSVLIYPTSSPPCFCGSNFPCGPAPCWGCACLAFFLPAFGSPPCVPTLPGPQLVRLFFGFRPPYSPTR